MTDETITDVVNFSGGVGSWAAAKRVAAARGTDGLRLLFADTLIEDDDLYRFLVQAAANVLGLPGPTASLTAALSCIPGVDQTGPRKAWLAYLAGLAQRQLPGLVWVAEGRTPWQVFTDERYLGNTRVDPCSKILKREFLDAWIGAHCDPSRTTVHIGIGHWERHRFEGQSGKPGLRQRKAAEGWRYEAPLFAPPPLSGYDLIEWLHREGIDPPRLYDLGWLHNNCGGGCVKAGQKQWALLLRQMPGRFGKWEAEEQAIRSYLGKDVSILRDRRGGKLRALTLVEFRENLEAGRKPDLTGPQEGCNCFMGPPDGAPGEDDDSRQAD